MQKYYFTNRKFFVPKKKTDPDSRESPYLHFNKIVSDIYDDYYELYFNVLGKDCKSCNVEHIVPRTYFRQIVGDDNFSNMLFYTELHNTAIAERNVNQLRDTYPFADLDKSLTEITDGAFMSYNNYIRSIEAGKEKINEKKGGNVKINKGVIEPPSNMKHSIAAAYFFMYYVFGDIKSDDGKYFKDQTCFNDKIMNNMTKWYMKRNISQMSIEKKVHKEKLVHGVENIFVVYDNTLDHIVNVDGDHKHIYHEYEGSDSKNISFGDDKYKTLAENFKNVCDNYLNFEDKRKFAHFIDKDKLQRLANKNRGVSAPTSPTVPVSTGQPHVTPSPARFSVTSPPASVPADLPSMAPPPASVPANLPSMAPPPARSPVTPPLPNWRSPTRPTYAKPSNNPRITQPGEGGSYEKYIKYKTKYLNLVDKNKGIR